MNTKTTFLVIFLILLGVGGGYYLGANYKLVLQPQGGATTTAPVPTDTLIQEAMVSPPAEAEGITPSPTVNETAAIIAGVKAGLIAEHGAGAANMNITVSKIQGNYAQGGAIEPEAVGGGMWLAAKVNGIWKLVWDGNGTISCGSINPYNFPVSMVSECWDDATQKSVTR